MKHTKNKIYKKTVKRKSVKRKLKQNKKKKQTRNRKNLKQKGGMKTFNYALYANFNETVKTKMSNVMDEIIEYVKSIDKFKSFWKEDPHITVFYGPPEQYKDDETALRNEKKTKLSICNELLRKDGMDFCKRFDDTLPRIRYTGVGRFKRFPNNDRTKKPFYILKFEFESPQLTNMQLYLRDMFPDVNSNMLKEEEFNKDGTRAYPPSKWAHSTITFIENVSEAKAREIQNKAEMMLAELGIKPGNYIQIDSISMTSCYTDTPVKLW